ncbi:MULTISPECIES: CG0192-related protein [unclassified Cryobacterium]|uniref:CG0192-related protein n=1 Tax=unclassified Cryobacterium TaxID=2649013 RepID=UPI002AB41639|nr:MULTISPECIES: hypothetical protein [unclassified Cryobacterium]MDY7527907.1 hypothetical protein [Cryobacterium sp. 10C2]MEB0004470.1 hypothetical protein [Cryobacterium sp. RTC2.1]MEB0200152.1 hypothetical protein [Cryobacterium sp. 5I3]MEB0291731.1 hypothetical protein [Cryobacterium sp. 10C2]
MALIHRAQLRPSKLELVEPWLRMQSWFAGDPSAPLTAVAAYRFDDPAGEVGIETLLVRAGDGPVLQVPLTYRDAPLEGGDAWLIGTMEHSVLGRRWTYDATGDPTYIAALATTIHRGGTQADEFVDVDGDLVFRESTATVAGSGTTDASTPALSSTTALSTRDELGSTVVEAGSLRLVVLRVPGSPTAETSVLAARTPTGGVPEHLSGTWADQPRSRILALAIAL